MRILLISNQLKCIQFNSINCNFRKKLNIKHQSLNPREFSTKAANVIPTVNRSNRLPTNGPGLKEFIVGGKHLFVAQSNPITPPDTIPYLNEIDYSGNGRKVFFEVYGCQMNVNDTEIVWSILKDNNYIKVDSPDEANVVLLITCAIRDKAERKVSMSTHTHKIIFRRNVR